MSELLVAQCPFCQTRFRLSQEHLQAAAGNVRCGACLKVFNANLAIAPPAGNPGSQIQDPVASPAAPSASVARENRRDAFMIHDDMDLDDLDLEALGLDESILDEINPAGRSSEPADDDYPDQAELLLEPEASADAAPDRDPEHGKSSAEADFEPSEPTQDETADPWDMLEESNNEIAPSDEAQPLPGSESTDQDNDDFDLHDDFLATPKARDFELERPAAPSTPATEPSAPTPGSADARADNGIFLRDRPTELAAREGRLGTEELGPEEATNRHEPRLGALIDLPDLDEPIVLYEEPRARRSRYRPLWITLSVLALLGLPGQALYYNFNTLAHNEQTRPYLEQFCFLAGCELPARVDIGLIRSSNLTVRSHPEYPNALAIDVILYNRAEFAQPFPVLRMTFNNTRGREVLSKRFRPDEYLGGELAGVTLMPPQTPVHIGLDMLDPGPEAAGYELDFLSP